MMAFDVPARKSRVRFLPLFNPFNPPKVSFDAYEPVAQAYSRVPSLMLTLSLLGSAGHRYTFTTVALTPLL
jgi:hypothetical protein